MVRISLCLCAIFIIASGINAQENETAEGHYRAGYELLQKRNFRNAAIEFEQAINADPTYGEAHYLLAQSYNVLNEHERAISAYEQARELGIRPEKCTDALGKLYNKSAISSLQQRKYGEAVVRFEQALQLAPNNAKTLYALGLSHNGNRDEKKAQNAFERAVNADPKYAKAYYQIADIQRRRREYGLASTTYQKAIDADAKYMAAYGGLARVKFATQDVEAIVGLMQAALKADPQYAEGHLFLGTALNQLGRQHEAIEPLRRATELDKKNPDAHFRLGEAHYGLGAYREAIESGQAAIRHDKSLAAAQALLGDAHFKLGQMSQARTHYARAQEDSRFKDYVAHQIEEIDRANRQP